MTATVRPRSAIIYRGVAAQIIRCCVLAAAAALGLPTVAPAALYQAGPDLVAYEAASGALPAVNGAWSYGTSATLGSAITLFPTGEHYDSIVLPGVPAGNLQGWQEDQNADLVPAVAVNTSAGNTASSCCGTYEPNEIWFHGGPPNGARSVSIVRWTAPSAGTATYSAEFIAEGGPNNNQVAVLINGLSAAPGFLGNAAGDSTANGTETPAVTAFSVNAGDTIDFALNAYNSTGLFASVDFTPVPEPTTLGVLGVAGLSLLARRRRA